MEKTDDAGRVATVFFKTGDDTLELRYQVGPVGCQPNETPGLIEPIILVWTPCHYGGRRPWFRCPGIIRPCARRVGILYATGAYFLCRHCCSLVYQSQREDVAGRAALRARRARARLGDHGALLDPLPKRPPGMRRKTYRRLCVEADEATELSLALALETVAKCLPEPIDLFLVPGEEPEEPDGFLPRQPHETAERRVVGSW